MRFKTGFVVGCAAGAWAAAKAAELRRLDRRDASWPRVVGSRAKTVSAEVAADKVRVVSDLARQRVNGLMEGHLGVTTRQRVTEIITTTLRQSSGSARGR
ncbi:MAG: hypothetical protein ACRD0Z_02805 [Acidimicrobiales bacterium]